MPRRAARSTKAPAAAPTHSTGDLFRISARTSRPSRCRRSPGSWRPRLTQSTGNWPTDYGVSYVAQILDALTSNPEVWAKTALFLMYDENDGFFDHVVPPHPTRR